MKPVRQTTYIVLQGLFNLRIGDSEAIFGFPPETLRHREYEISLHADDPARPFLFFLKRRAVSRVFFYLDLRQTQRRDGSF